MPSRKTQDGYKEICFPVTAEFRNQLYGAVMDAYHQALELHRLRRRRPLYSKQKLLETVSRWPECNQNQPTITKMEENDMKMMKNQMSKSALP